MEVATAREGAGQGVAALEETAVVARVAAEEKEMAAVAVQARVTVVAGTAMVAVATAMVAMAMAEGMAGTAGAVLRS